MSDTFNAPTNLSDEKLFRLCRMYGARSLEWRNKFIGLLPEVNRRKLYEKKGFGSIFEFAAKLAGVSKEQLGTVINLEKDFEDKPLLKRLLVTGEVSINKLVRIQSVATSENQAFWANQVQLLPNRALETLVRDERESQNQDGFQKPLFEANELHVQPKHLEFSSPISGQHTSLNLSNEVKERLAKLQAKGIDINQLLTELLDQHEEAITAEKNQISQEMSEKPIKKTSRYIPSKIKKVLSKEHGTKCSISTCEKAAKQIHHTQRFSLAKNQNSNLDHDPSYLAPLCKEHHQIAHSIDIQYHEVRQRQKPLTF